MGMRAKFNFLLKLVRLPQVCGGQADRAGDGRVGCGRRCRHARRPAGGCTPTCISLMEIPENRNPTVACRWLHPHMHLAHAMRMSVACYEWQACRLCTAV